MIKFENVVAPSPDQWKSVIMGARNPMNSWDRSDSASCHRDLLRDCKTCVHGPIEKCWRKGFDIGPNDFDLMMRLRNAGTDHRKFMRMLPVIVTITAPLYWWKEFSTYKVGTVSNSCSTMHKIQAKEFTLEDFSCEHLLPSSKMTLLNTIADLNHWRDIYVNGGNITFYNNQTGVEVLPKDKRIWWQMIQLLPSSYNQRRTIMMNFEVLANIYKSRKDHRLNEWRELCDWIKTLPYSELIVGDDKNEKR